MIVSINSKEIKVPLSWNELSLNQQLKAYNIIMVDTKGLFDDAELMSFKRIELLKVILDVDDEFLKTWEKDCIDHFPKDGQDVFFGELDALLVVSNALFHIEEKLDKKFYQIKLELTKCPWPQLRLKNQQLLFAPTHEMENISLNELGMVLTLFDQYMESKEEEDLHELLATIYRPAKAPSRRNKAAGYHGDIRRPLLGQEHLIEKRKAYFKNLPLASKQLLLFWIASCRQYFIQSYPMVFNGKGEASDFGFGALIMSLAGELIHIDKVSNTSAHDALTYLSFLEEQRRKTKKKKTPA
jgi:hypothetical protein